MKERTEDFSVGKIEMSFSDLSTLLNYNFRSDAGYHAQKELLGSRPTQEQIRKARLIKTVEERTIMSTEFSDFEKEYMEQHKGNYAQALDRWVERKLKEQQQTPIV